MLSDLFKSFHHDAIHQEFPTSTRVLFDTLLFEFDAQNWPDKLGFSERELTCLTGLPKTTLNDAKHFLASRGYIKIKRTKKTTLYMFSRPPTDQEPTSCRPPTDRPIMPISNRVMEATHNKQQPSHSSENLSIYLPSRAREYSELEKTLDHWERLSGPPLRCEQESELRKWLAEMGGPWVIDAMNQAADANTNPRGLSFKFLRGCVNRLKKEVAKDDSRAQIRSVRPKATVYDLSGTDITPEW